MKSKIYDLETLISNQREVEDYNYDSLSIFKGRLKPLFPIDKGFDKKKSNPWAFKCLCGNFCVQDYGQVKRGSNKSCGCLNKINNRNKHMILILKNLLQKENKLVLTKQGSSYSSRDWGFKCLECGTQKESLNVWEVFRRKNSFCWCNGSVFCKTREEAKLDLINKLKDTVWSLHKFPKEFTKKGTCRVDLLCNNCKTVHKDVLFGNAYRKGCPECKRLRLKHVCFHKSRAEDKKEFYLTIPSGVYLSEVGKVYKIGITCDLHKRHKEIEKDVNLKTKNIYYREMNLYDALMLEHILHKQYDKERYYFNYIWAGHSECFNLSEDSVNNIIKSISNYRIYEDKTDE